MPTTITPISGPKRLITSADDGNFILLGNASEGRVGCFAVQIEVSQDWVGQLIVMGRIYLKESTDANAGLHQFPYKQIYLNGVAALRETVNTVITTNSTIEIPANGWSVGFGVSWTAGTATLYSLPMDGPSVA